MLILSRKKNESIIIGDNIKIIVLSIVGNTVRLGIEASKEIPVIRSEIGQRKANDSENRENIL